MRNERRARWKAEKKDKRVLSKKAGKAEDKGGLVRAIG
jgi:hypothetical protein